jgi:hypothetical protein
VNQGHNRKWNWEWILMDVSTMQDAPLDASSTDLFLGSNLD